jgi:hypothetical protein
LIGTMLNLLINFNPGERRKRNESRYAAIDHLHSSATHLQWPRWVEL